MELIIFGLDDNLDISYYADPKYNILQMREILNLLKYNKIRESNIDIKRIAKVRYNNNQMHELAMGLINGLNISIYENSEYSAEQMQLIRIGLEKGLNVQEYANPDYDVDKMNQIMHQLKGKQTFLTKFLKHKI